MPTNILIYRVGHLGDIVCSMPSMVALRKRFPKARITLLTNKSENSAPDAEKILAGNDFLDEIITYDSSRVRNLRYLYKLIISLSQKKFDSVVYLPISATTKRRLFRDYLIFKLFVSRNVFGFSYPKPISKSMVHCSSFPFYNNETERLLSAIAPIGIDTLNIEYRLPIRDADREFVDNLWRINNIDFSSDVIAISPASKFQSKTWSLDRFIEVIDYLSESYKATIVLIGGASEVGAGEYISGRSKYPIVNLISKTNFMQSAVALSKCRLFIANDCGPVHLAAAVRTPVIGIYASVHYPGAWHPWGDIHTVLRNDNVSCRFCFKEYCSHKTCLESIDSDVVINACNKHLSGKYLSVSEWL
jgi:ADP-heptose:LPS heptosyltransferase